MFRPLSTLIAPALLLVAHLPAQLAGTNQAVGYAVAKAGTGYTGAIQTQDIDGNCQATVNRCTPVGSPAGLGGGAAYDARHRSLWVAYGTTIEEHHLGACKTVFKFTASPLNPKSMLSGLAISDRHRQLYHLETSMGTLGVRAYDLTTMPPKPLAGGWTTKLAGMGPMAGAMAYDEARDRFYVAVSFSAFNGWMTEVYVFRPGNPPTLTGKLAVPMPSNPNPPQPVTGLAYDARTRRIYATDGTLTVAGTVLDPDKGLVQWARGSCSKSLSGVYVGLSVIPGWSQKAVGSSCLGTPCAACPAMGGTLSGGDPVLGNSAFGLSLNGAPLNASAFLVLGGGACTSGLQLPQLCGPLYPSFAKPPIVVATGLTGGTTGCGGSASAPLPIPAAAALAGVRLCAQWILACTGSAGLGLGVTGAIEFEIAGG